MTAPATFKQADVTRAVRGAIAAGLVIAEIRITAEELRILAKSSVPKGDDEWADLD